MKSRRVNQLLFLVDILSESSKLQKKKTMIEIEQKYRISNPTSIRRQLSEMGAKRLRSGDEYNELYDYNGDLKKKNHLLRLRRFGSKYAWLTFKGPRQKGPYKKRIEIETPVEYEGAKQILEFLNFRVVDEYAKKREEYEFDSCKICLDFLETHGWFLEIEGLPKQIDKLAKRLQLEKSHQEHRSYRKLLKEAI